MTDDSLSLAPVPAPAIILVRPQLGENIGKAARAMLNFGLEDMRLVAPRDGWPNPSALPAAAGADRLIAEARVFADVAAAVRDCDFVYATSARRRAIDKPVLSPEAAVQAMRVDSPQTTRRPRSAILFGAERSGLDSDAVAFADALVNVPVNPTFASLNLAQAVAILAYEWKKAEALDANSEVRLSKNATLDSGGGANGDVRLSKDSKDARLSKRDTPTPKVDTPKGDTPEGDTPEVDIPKGDTPEGDIPKGDTPAVDIETQAEKLTDSNTIAASDFADSSLARQAALHDLFEHLCAELEAKGYFYPPERTASTRRTLRHVLSKSSWSLDDIQMIRGIIARLANQRRG